MGKTRDKKEQKTTSKQDKKRPKKRAVKKKAIRKKKNTSTSHAKFPRHSVEKALRIPKAILDQNAGQDCSDRDAAKFAGLSFAGPFRVELSSAKKFGLLTSPATGQVSVTELAKQIIRAQEPEDMIIGLQMAIQNAPDIANVYKHYRGENLPDAKFFNNALIDNFKIPIDKIEEFKVVLKESLESANLIEKHGNKHRVIDISADSSKRAESLGTLKELEKATDIKEGDSCFVMMPFSKPIGDYYSKIYEPAVIKAGFKPIRADDEIFGTGKIMDQIWTGLNNAKVLIAELTGRNPNVFYELGLAHALNKPVVLVSSNEKDVPFDLHHIRVIYYDLTDPFWGEKLIEKVAENILSAIKNPEEALFTRILSK